MICWHFKIDDVIIFKLFDLGNKRKVSSVCFAHVRRRTCARVTVNVFKGNFSNTEPCSMPTANGREIIGLLRLVTSNTICISSRYVKATG